MNHFSGILVILSLMNRLESIIVSARRRLKVMAFAYRRLTLFLTRVTAVGGVALDVATFIASVMCLTALSLLVGFDYSIDRSSVIDTVLYWVRILFIVKISLNIIFRFHTFFRRSRLIKWIAAVAVLLTAVPLFFHVGPDSPAFLRFLSGHKFIYSVLAVYSVLTVSFGLIRILGKRTNPALILGGSFLIFIFLGALLLLMPKSTYSGISFADALFVSTSAVCITGLTPVEITSTFTPMGILIIGILCQIGGLGVMTLTSFFALFFSGNTSIYSQLMVKDMVYSTTVNSLLPTLLYILGFTLVIEAIGAVVFFFSIHGLLGMSLRDEIFASAFHSMSAFCNAGFSNIPLGMSNPALLHGNQSVYIVLSLLILAGGIGFPILVNFKDAVKWWIRRIFRRNRHVRVHYIDMNTKIVLAATAVIMVAGPLLFFILENNNTLAGMTPYEKGVQSVFNIALTRTAGFASLNPASFLGPTLMIVVFCMWVGGASQSTAGGIKVNTLATVLLNLRSVLTGRARVSAFGRTISEGSVKRAYSVLAASIVLVTLYSFLMLWLEPALPGKAVIFETISAFFTVGSSLGITSHLSEPSEYLLCSAMFLGRVGALSILTGLCARRDRPEPHFPTDSIIIN